MSDGHTRKRGDRWYAVYRVTDPVTGAKKQRYEVAGKSRQEAQRLLRTRVTELETGSYVEISKLTLAQFVSEEWLPAVRGQIKPATFESYARNLRVHVIPALGGVQLRGLTAPMLNRFYAELLEQGRRPPGKANRRYPESARRKALQLRTVGNTYESIATELAALFPECAGVTRHGVARMLARSSETSADASPGLAPRTVAYIHTIIHRALRDAVRWRHLPYNPADAADPPRAESDDSEAPMRTWNAGQLLSFLKGCEDNRYLTAWLTLATTGLRRGELLGLRLDTVDLDGKRLRIVRTLGTVNHVLVEGSPKTRRGRRTVSLDTHTTAMLRAWRARRAEERLALGLGSFTDDGYFFCHPDGRPFHPDRFSREFDRAVSRLGLPRIRLHDLRHTYASLALESGEHPRVMSERLGHASTAITNDIYSHVTPQMDAQLAERQAQRIFGES